MACIFLNTLTLLNNIPFYIKYTVYDGENAWVSMWVSEWINEWVSEWMSEWVSVWVSEWVSEWVIDLVVVMVAIQLISMHVNLTCQACIGGKILPTLMVITARYDTLLEPYWWWQDWIAVLTNQHHSTHVFRVWCLLYIWSNRSVIVRWWYFLFRICYNHFAMYIIKWPDLGNANLKRARVTFECVPILQTYIFVNLKMP